MEARGIYTAFRGGVGVDTKKERREMIDEKNMTGNISVWFRWKYQIS